MILGLNLKGSNSEFRQFEVKYQISKLNMLVITTKQLREFWRKYPPAGGLREYSYKKVYIHKVMYASGI